MRFRMWVRILMLLLLLVLVVLFLTHYQRHGKSRIRYAASLAAGLAFGGYWLHDGLVHFRRYRAYRGAGRGRIRDLAPGTVELRGTIAADRPQPAPLSGKPCAWWRLRLERQVWAARTKEWVTAIEAGSVAPFAVADPSGALAVDPAGLEPVGDPATVTDPYKPGHVPDEFRQLLIDHQLLDPERPPYHTPLRLAEWSIPAGTAVTVFGELAVVDGKRSVRRDESHQLFVVIGPGQDSPADRQGYRALAGLLGGGILGLLTLAGLLLTLGIVT